MFINDLARYAVQRSLLAGASLPTAFCGEYVSRISHAFIRLNEAGWKPVTGALVRGEDFELARYGLSDRSWLVVCNRTNATRRAVLEVFADEIENGIVGGKKCPGGFIYASFFGGEAANSLRSGEERVGTIVGSLGVRVLESVGRAKGEGTVFASWGGDGCGEVKLLLRSKDFRGTVLCRSQIEGYVLADRSSVSLSEGETVILVYRDPILAPIVKQLEMLDLSNLEKLVVECAADSDSHEMAERIAHFFKVVTWPKNADSAAKHVSPVRISENAALKRLTVGIGGCRIAAEDRMAFSRLVRRVLNALNAKRYPDYRAEPAMDGIDRPFFEMTRY